MTVAFVDPDPTTSTSTGSTTHTVDLPGSLVVGDWLLALSVTGTGSTLGADEAIISWADEWLIYGRRNNGFGRFYVSVVEVDAALAAKATTTFDQGGGVVTESTTHVFHLRGDPITWLRFAYETSGASTTSPDPPSLTTGYGAVEHIWIAAVWHTSSGSTSAGPAGYGNLASSEEGDVGLASAHKTTTAATEDPGTFTWGTARTAGQVTIGLPTADQDAGAGFPTFKGRTVSTNDGGTGSQHVVPIPSTPPGTGTVITMTTRDDTVTSTPTGWTLLGADTDPLSIVEYAAYYRDGGGGDVTFPLSGGGQSVAIVEFFDDVDFSTAPPTIELEPSANSTTVDPPAETFSSGGYAVMAGHGHTLASQPISFPTNYLAQLFQTTLGSGTSTATVTDQFRFVSGTSENPGTYTLDTGRTQVRYTIAVPGVASVPSAPTNPAAVAQSSTVIRVTWDDVSDETGYRVERSLNGSSGWTDVSGNLAADTVSYDDTGLTAETQYFYRVIAFNGAGDSNPSSTVNATTSAASSSNRMGGTGAIRRSPRTPR